MKRLIWLVVMALIVIIMPSCAVKRIPVTQPGMTLVANKATAERKIWAFPGSYGLEEIKGADPFNNSREMFLISPLRLWGESNYLIFRSMEFFKNPPSSGRIVDHFTLPCSYMRLQRDEMAGQTAVLYLRPYADYTLYVRDIMAVSGAFLGEEVIHFHTSGNATNDYRDTYSGRIWADKIIDLSDVDTQSINQIRVKICIGNCK